MVGIVGVQPLPESPARRTPACMSTVREAAGRVRWAVRPSLPKLNTAAPGVRPDPAPQRAPAPGSGRPGPDPLRAPRSHHQPQGPVSGHGRSSTGPCLRAGRQLLSPRTPGCPSGPWSRSPAASRRPPRARQSSPTLPVTASSEFSSSLGVSVSSSRLASSLSSRP